MKFRSAFARAAIAALVFSPVAASAAGLTPSTAYLWSSLNPSTVGDAVTFSALVTGDGSVPTGSVTFKKYGSTTINSDVTLQTVGAGSTVSTGYHHTCYVTHVGGVKCSGANDKGQLGDGTTNDSEVFVDVAGLTGLAVAVSLGYNTSCAILADATAMCWGGNSDGQLGTGAAGDNAAHATPAAVSGLTNIKSLGVGDNHICALTIKGAVYCWGQNSNGQLGNDSSPSDKLTPTAVNSLTSGVKALAAGSDFNCILNAAGGVKCWGHNFYGSVGNGGADFRYYTPVDVTGLTSGAVAIGAGANHACAGLDGGGMKCWGLDDTGQLGDGTSGGGNQHGTPVAVLNVSDVIASINGGYSATCALTTGGGIYCWGAQQGGQIGDGSDNVTTNSTAVIPTGMSSGAVSIDSNRYHSCAAITDGSVKCWGWDFDGQQGHGTTGTIPTPTTAAAAGSMLGVGTAATTTSSLVADTTPITAVYSGDSTYAGSTSNTVNQTIQGLPSTTTITSNTPNPSVAGATITVNVTVSGNSTPPDGGIITLKDNNTDSVAFGSVTNGSASLTVSTLGVGVHALTAYFSGDNVYNSSFSSDVSQTVQGATTLSGAATPNPAAAGDSIAISATVDVVAPATGTPTGTVSFADGATSLGSAPVQSGTATLGTNLTVGTHVVVATYSGDSNFLGSTKNIRIVVKANIGLQKVVSATPGFAQHQPKIAALKKGYVVAWTSDGQDNGGRGIFAQRYSPLGIKVGSEFQVNTMTAGDQSNAVLAGLLGGTFVAAWQSAGQDGSGAGIYMQRYSITGAPSGNELRVNTTRPNDQSQPAIAALSDGGYIVVWTSSGQDGSGLGIYAQRYKPNGQKVGLEFKVNATTAGDQSHPDVAALGDGFVVTWQGPDASGLGIYFQRFDSASSPVGPESRVNIVTTNDQTLPAIAQLADGRFVIAWQSNLQDLDGLGIYMQVYTSAGARSGSNVKVNTKRTGNQATPAVAAFSDRGFVVTWMSSNQDGSGQGIFGQVFTTDGQATDVELRINTQTAGDQTEPAVAAFSGGTFVTVWTDAGGADTDIYAQRAAVPVPAGD